MLLLMSCWTFSPSVVFAQVSEEKPKYAPGKEKHRNRTDEIGRKQGKWMYYNTFGEKILETDFVNDQKEGVERKFYGYDRVREETEYLAGVKKAHIHAFISLLRFNWREVIRMEKKTENGHVISRMVAYAKRVNIKWERKTAYGKHITEKDL